MEFAGILDTGTLGYADVSGAAGSIARFAAPHPHRSVSVLGKADTFSAATAVVARIATLPEFVTDLETLV